MKAYRGNRMLRRLGLVLGFLTIGSVSVSAASAQSPRDAINKTFTTSQAPNASPRVVGGADTGGGGGMQAAPPTDTMPVAPPSGKPPVAVMPLRTGRRCKNVRRGLRRIRTCTTYKRGRATRVCKTVRRPGRSVRTCRTYKRGKVVRVCTKRGRAAQRCRKPRRLSSVRAIAAANVSEGFSGIVPAMGRIWALLPNGQFTGLCSGTMNGANVLLTAGHCLYDQDAEVDGTKDYYANKFPLFFIPGNGFVANGGGEADARSAPWGAFRVTNHAVPDCWATVKNDHCDVGFAILAPNGAGDAGNIVGSYRWATGACCSVGQLIQSAGYPGSLGFETYDYGWGNAPYQCTNRLEAGSGLVGSTGYSQFHACSATGGSSGGPVWTQLNDGNWYLIGVNNRATFQPFAQFADAGIFQPFDTLMSGFYCNVIGGCAAAARTSRESRAVFTRAAPLAPSARRAAFRSLGLRSDGTPKDTNAR